MTDQRLALDFAASSDRGLVRTNNEDSAYAGPRLLALADGMGGHAAGEVASRFLVDTLRTLDSPLLDEPDERRRLISVLERAVDEGNQRIASHVDENPQLEGMGCTLTAILFSNGKAAMCHVGDSRAYRLRDGELTQITKDDTFVQTLVDEGKLDAADASSHPQRSLILKALTGRPVEPTLTEFEALPGDRYLLCSDGLSDPVSIDTMRDILNAYDPATAADRLVEMALRGGGPDNVTVVVADVVDLAAVENDAAGEDGAASSAGRGPLPETPMLAGAASPTGQESRSFDTPAARAAASGASVTSSRTPRPPKDPEEMPEPADTAKKRGGSDQAAAPASGAAAATGPGGTDVPKKKRGRGWIALVIALVLVVGLGIAGFFGYQKIGDTYFVAVEGKQIVVKNGVHGSLLGVSLNSTHQRICLDESASVRLIGADNDAPEDCHLFLTSDLTPSARSTVESMPEDSYQAVVEQVNRLAEETLPVCVTREKKKDGKRPSADRATSTARKGAEDLTTPGVSCREVK
ncbi:PP2C family serine/threonine-protein phosphatase [Corynebacterium sp. HMSC27B11]|uniref:PP2C family protein-serine/threonine phosphatase n=1 Tax=Corynebacterium sp. HMSC27B11 TaxID=1581065 RepID=UPI0008A1393A|nr:protein phosphatase 2C domain-containing protein [Corynebacterium sp. HMSC27B11]OFS16766.1 protein phosphatase [Corynebacterium sp. HMSC27B11]